VRSIDGAGAPELLCPEKEVVIETICAGSTRGMLSDGGGGSRGARLLEENSSQ